MLSYFSNEVSLDFDREDELDTTDTRNSVAIWTSRASAQVDSRLPPTIRAALQLIEYARPAEPHQLLGWIGAHHRVRGGGLGSAVIAHGLARADRRKRATVLWTANERSRAFFKHHGYRVTKQLDPAGSPTVWWMWRPVPT